MGKQAGPSPEELEFIFECFNRGLSDGEVLWEMQDTEFPVRNVRFIRDRRKEFNAAKKVLEYTVKQNVDPVLTKYREEHYASVGSIIEKWREALPYYNPLITEVIDDIKIRSRDGYWRLKWDGSEIFAGPLRQISQDPLFKCIREHLPSDSFWNTYSEWERSIAEFLRIIRHIQVETREDGEKWPELLELSDKFEDPLFELINGMIIDLSSEIEYTVSKAEWLEVSIYNREIESKTSKKVIRAKNPEDYKERYNDLLKRWLTSNEAARLKILSRQIEKNYGEIENFLEDVTISKTYINYPCSLCPSVYKL